MSLDYLSEKREILKNTDLYGSGHIKVTEEFRLVITESWDWSQLEQFEQQGK